MEQRPRRRLMWVWGLVMVASFAAFANGCSSSDDSSSAPASVGVPGSLIPMGEPPATARKVSIGLYAVNAYDLDVTSNTFYLSGYLWVRWTGDDPTAGLEFANSVQDWDFTQLALSDEPTALDTGEKLMQYRIQGRFFEPFDLGKYPLDHQQLSILLEDSMATADAVVYVPDEEQTGLDAGLSIPGWKVAGLTSATLLHDYGTSFGDTTAGTPAPYAALRFSLELDRARNLFVWKLMLPLVLVLATNWLALLLHPRLIEVRTAMPATALLTTVFLQQSSMAGLPEVSELVLMDLMYVLAYALIVVTFCHIVYDNSRMREEDPGEAAFVRRWDRVSLAIQIAVAVAAVPVVLMLQG